MLISAKWSKTFKTKNLKGETAITQEHVDNNKTVRKMLAERGVKPGQLPAAEDVQKVKRKLEKEDKQVLKKIKKTGSGNNEESAENK